VGQHPLWPAGINVPHSQKVLSANRDSPFANTTQTHGSNRDGIDKPFRVFEGKYSILIDMRELEASMSGLPTTMIARGMHRLPAPRKPARGTATLREPLVAFLPLRRISVLLMAQRPDKVATAA